MSKTTILEVYQDKKGKYQWRLLARDGKQVVSSEKFEKKAQALAQAKKLSDMVSKAVLVDADKKADAASKTTGKRPAPKKQAADKTVASKAKKKTASPKVVVSSNA